MKKIETLFLAQLLKENIEDAPNTKLVKFTANSYIKASEKFVNDDYARVYVTDPEMTINICQKLELIAQTVSKLQLDEMVLFADFAEKFYENREQIKTDAETFFNEILL